MPRINKKPIKQAAKAAGQTKKQVRQTVAKAAKDANGGKTRMGRIIKGAVKAGISAIPGVGGGIADALMGNGKVDPPMMPALSNTSSSESTAPNISTAPALSTAPIVKMDAIPPALSNTPTPATTIAQSTFGGGGGGGGSIADDADMQDVQDKQEKQNKQARQNIPTDKEEIKPTPAAPKKSKVIWYVVGGILLLATIIYLVKKSK